jgi:hypothetical protein
MKLSTTLPTLPDDTYYMNPIAVALFSDVKVPSGSFEELTCRIRSNFVA